jgi:tripartite-type tricarboxylate transporter receptor subunit TctC
MKNYTKLILNIFIIAMLLTLVNISKHGLAQEKFPSKPITVIVAWAPGGGMDSDARAVQPPAEKILGQPIIIVNKPGAGGTIGFTEGAKATPDGYTITQVSAAIVSTHYTISKDIDYRNYEPVILTSLSPGTIYVKKDAPWKSLKEFLDYARANPGKIRMVNPGHGSAGHIRAVGVEYFANVKFTHVPYKGTMPGIMAVIGGHAEAITSGLSDGFHLIEGGKVRAIGITASERVPVIPDVQTFKELGMDYESYSWFGYLVPKGTPKERIKILHEAFKKATESQEYIEYTKKRAVIPRRLGPKELLKFLEEEDRIWSKLLEVAGLKK